MMVGGRDDGDRADSDAERGVEYLELVIMISI